MHTWFECKIRYEKTMENGMNKKVTEPYLVDALSFTEAEARIIEEISPFISGEFSVSAVKRTRIAEIFFDILIVTQSDVTFSVSSKTCRV